MPDRRIFGALVAIVVLAGCAGSAGVSAPAGNPAVVDTPAPNSVDTPEPVAEATPNVVNPKSYAKLAKRDWAKVVKAPDKYLGKGYQLWGCVTQFDAATGTDTFRANASYRKEPDWYVGDNAFFVGTEKMLGDVVTGDIVSMNAVGLGSFSYDTQAGGNTTVPLFRVTKIARKGSC